ncbi:hypothetical protein Hanom_Chr14g01265741 [Helianthus anomalus]
MLSVFPLIKMLDIQHTNTYISQDVCIFLARMVPCFGRIFVFCVFVIQEQTFTHTINNCIIHKQIYNVVAPRSPKSTLEHGLQFHPH